MIYNPNKNEKEKFVIVKIVVMLYYFFICVKSNEIIGDNLKDGAGEVVIFKKDRDIFYMLSIIQFLFYPVFASLYLYGVYSGEILES